jgi:hypothetical protein
MPTSVSFPGFAETFKLAIVEHLAPLFNGATHVLGGVSIPFPIVEFAFDPHAITELAGLVIAFTAVSPANEQRLRCNNPVFPGGIGIELRSDLICNVTIAGPKGIEAAAQNRQDVDKAWAALYAAVCCSGQELADRNIKQVRLDPVADDATPIKAVRVEISGIMTAQIQVQYSPNNG